MVFAVTADGSLPAVVEKPGFGVGLVSSMVCALLVAVGAVAVKGILAFGAAGLGLGGEERDARGR